MRTLKRFLLLLSLVLVLCFSLALAEDEWPYAIRKGSASSPMVAITMDDCSSIKIVEQTFRYCVEQEVYITFFPIGVNVKPEDAAIWREIAESPWAEIGCHTQHHYCWEKCHKATIGKELDEFRQTLDNVLGYHYPVQQVRPPHGHYRTTREGGNSKTIQKITTEHGFPHIILWSIDVVDAPKVLRQVKNGSIMLYHAYNLDLKCIRGIVPTLKERGYQPVTVSMLLGMEKPTPQLPAEE